MATAREIAWGLTVDRLLAKIAADATDAVVLLCRNDPDAGPRCMTLADDAGRTARILDAVVLAPGSDAALHDAIAALRALARSAAISGSPDAPRSPDALRSSDVRHTPDGPHAPDADELAVHAQAIVVTRTALLAATDGGPVAEGVGERRKRSDRAAQNFLQVIRRLTESSHTQSRTPTA
jgi:hypothetical protein